MKESEKSANKLKELTREDLNVLYKKIDYGFEIDKESL